MADVLSRDRAGTAGPDTVRSDVMDVVSDLRLYLHQTYGVSLRPRPALMPRQDDAVAVDPSALDAVRAELGDCQRCRLCESRKTIVFGDGPPNSRVLIVGEAPGAEEDSQGKPFVGRSGQLLSKMLEAINLDRSSVYITNVVKCRPPQNRDPKADEVAECSPFLLEQIRVVNPALILALGTFAAQTLLKSDEPIMKLRGSRHVYAGVPLIVTLHPAACLYNASNKKYVWQDIKGIPRMLNHGG